MTIRVLIAEGPVDGPGRHILAKLGPRDRVQAVILAYQARLFEKHADAQ